MWIFLSVYYKIIRRNREINWKSPIKTLEASVEFVQIGWEQSQIFFISVLCKSKRTSQTHMIALKLV